MTDQADPEFLALPQRQRARIDRAFDRGLPKLRSSGRKRRKLTHDAEGQSTGAAGAMDVDGGGGFMPDYEGEGGFMDADGAGAGGGFMPDDDEGGGGGGFTVDEGDEEGGFMPDEDGASAASPPPREEPAPPVPKRSITSSDGPVRSGKVSLSDIPRLLAFLNLPADEDVLNVFKASATGWTTDGEDDGGGRRGRGRGDDGEEKLGVERKDFRAVCAAIMDGGDEGDDTMDIDQVEVGGDSDSSDGEDAFELDEGSELSSLSSDSEYGASKKRTRAATSRTTASAKGKGKARDTGDDSAPPAPAKTRRKKGANLMEQAGPLKLVGRQREVARELWDMMKRTNGEEAVKKPKKGEGSAHILGREEIKMWVREMGEMWTEDEITDMVTLFSSQHEGRGLSFDDFGQIMLRARVV